MRDERKRMVREIEKKYGLTSPDVIDVMLQIPRHKFVQERYRNIAYSDGPVPLGYGQTMSQPYTVAFMTHLIVSSRLYVSGNGRNNVLEVGTGSGYQAAILSKFFEEVFTVEIVPELARKARKTLARLGYSNVFVKEGSGEWGWEEKAPFDAIIITAAVEKEIPEKLVEELATGGVIVAPIGPRSGQTMTRFTKREDGSLAEEDFQQYVFVPFVEEKN